LKRATCRSCSEHSYWIDAELVWPHERFGPLPNPDLPGALTEIYTEARDIAARSHRAAAALLRLVIDRLTIEIGGDPRKMLHDRIGSMQDDGLLPGRVVDALDAVRVTGNDAIHVGEIRSDGFDDDTAVVRTLFELVNLITAVTLSVDRQTDALIPATKKRKRGEGDG
jgi:hypothetical protein